MPTPLGFPEVNSVFQLPGGVGIGKLPAYRGPFEYLPGLTCDAIISRWRLDDKEVQDLLADDTLYLIMLTKDEPPPIGIRLVSPWNGGS